MKRNMIFTLPLLALGMAMASCDDELKEQAALEVGVVENDQVSVVGDTIFVNSGEPLTFQFAGDPDFITFFSGEAGKKYEYRNRDQVDPADVVSSKLKFSVWYQYGNAKTSENLLSLFISDSFPGLLKNNFKADSTLVEQFNWNNLVDPAMLPAAPGNAAGAANLEVDLSPYLGKRFAIAARYMAHNNSAAQPRVNFVRMRIENQMKDGSISTLYANDFGLTAVNMLANHNLEDQRGMTANRLYGTVTNNISGIWNLASAGSGNFFIHSSNAGKTLKYSWLVSGLIIANACSPDYGMAIKNISGRLDTYSYTYDKAGVYKATFIATNSNYKSESRVIRELNIRVKK
ncbi:MAG: DUF5017 domain-containing protein [Prevotella sp.]|nr:DUF5017 domain-containing protein [Prevotella sp.]MDY4040356.1 DUF5017 domain-containing protein [Prevotella sp.]